MAPELVCSPPSAQGILVALLYVIILVFYFSTYCFIILFQYLLKNNEEQFLHGEIVLGQGVGGWF